MTALRGKYVVLEGFAKRLSRRDVGRQNADPNDEPPRSRVSTDPVEPAPIDGVSLSPPGHDPGRALHHRGVDAYRRGEYALAASLLEEASRTSGATRWTWLNLSRSLWHLQRFEEARVAAEAALAASPRWTEAVLQLGDALIAQGQRGRTLRLLHALLAEHPRDAAVVRKVATRFRRLPAYPEALATADALLALAPGDEEGLRCRAVALWETGALDEAMELLPTVEGGLPKEWVRRVTARYELARRGALPAYRLFEAAPRRIEDGALLAEIADALWSEGHVLEALGAYERLVAMHPDDQVLRRRRDAALSEARWLLDAEDPVADDAGEPATPVAGRVMYLVADAFPFTRSPTGEALHARARSLLSAGWQPTVVTLLPQPWNLDATDVALCERIDGVEYVRLLPAGPVDGPPNEVLAENFRALADVARHVRPAVIHVENDVLAAMAGTALGRSLKVPAVWEVRSLPHEAWAEADATRSKDRQYYRLWKRLVRRCLNDAHTVVTTSPAMRQHVLDLGIAPARAKHFAGPLVEATPAAAEHWRALYEAASTTDTSQDESAIAATGSGNRP